MNEPMWEYIDRYDKLQGPFSTSQMRQWYLHRMLPANLPLRTGKTASFRPLDVIFVAGETPFEKPPMVLFHGSTEPLKPLPRPKKDPKGVGVIGKGTGTAKGKGPDVQYFPTRALNEDCQASHRLNSENYGYGSPSYIQSASSSSSSRNNVLEKKGEAQPGLRKDKGSNDGLQRIGKDGKDCKGKKGGKEDGKGSNAKGNEWYGYDWNYSEERHNAVDTRKWEYLDSQNKVQGPFDHSTMLRWYEARFLPRQLKVRLAEGSKNWGEFLNGSRPGKHISDLRALECGQRCIFEQRNQFAEPPPYWSIDRVIRESDGSLWEEKWICPLRIRFSQREIHPFFHHRGSIEEVLPDIERKILDRDDGDDRPPICELRPPFPPIRVVELNDQTRMVQNDVVITLDNRRLYALQRVALEAWPKLTIVKVWASPWSQLTQKKLKNEWRKFSHGKDGGVAATITSRAKVWETWDWRQESADMERVRFPQLAILPTVDHPRAQLTGTLSFSLLPLFCLCYLNLPSVQKRIVKNYPLIFHIAKVFGRPTVANFRTRKILLKHSQDLVHGRACSVPKVGVPYTAKATVKVSREGTQVQVRATLGKGPPNGVKDAVASQSAMSRSGEVCAMEVSAGYLTFSQLAFSLQMLPWAGLPIVLASKTTKARRRLAVSLLLTYGYFMIWRGREWIAE